MTGSQLDPDRLTPRIETDRLILRGWRDDDLDAHAAMSADPEVERFLAGTATGWSNASGRRDARPRRALESGRLVRRRGGMEARAACLGQRVRDRGGGSGDRVGLRELPIDEIISVIDPDNERSITVADRLGMQLLRTELLDGAPVLIMGISRNRADQAWAASVRYRPEKGSEPDPAGDAPS